MSEVKIKENEIAIFYPNDANMPCIKINENKKIIINIDLNMIFP